MSKNKIDLSYGFQPVKDSHEVIKANLKTNEKSSELEEFHQLKRNSYNDRLKG